ncbi:MAG TPA: outer membrane beta-barrel protein [Ignavibacteriaceae bacterium]|nr:outer membrane beta-barrel protein [Ignavibacteriaceae bacterium]
MISTISFSLKSLVIISLPILFATQVYSQDSTYLDKLNGSFALQFQISGNFTLSQFQGGTFSGKYHFGPRSAIRVGLSTLINNSEDDITASEIDSFFVHPSYTNSFDYQVYSVNLQYLNYLTALESVGFFIGAGPYVSYAFSKQDIDTADVFNYNSSSTSTLWNLGIELLAGVEWMFNDKMTLSAEYGLRAYYLINETAQDVTYLSKNISSKRKGFNLIYSSIKFGLSVYF